MPALELFQERVAQFHELRKIFITSSVRASISLPQQHALSHYFMSIQLFGSPNGLCSSITESKHIKAVKEPWRRSNCNNVLSQILQTLLQLEKMAALRRLFTSKTMLKGTTVSYMASVMYGENTHEDLTPLASEPMLLEVGEDGRPVDGVCKEETLSLVTLSAATGASVIVYFLFDVFM
jgi:hypothetical protein